MHKMFSYTKVSTKKKETSPRVIVILCGHHDTTLCFRIIKTVEDIIQKAELYHETLLKEPLNTI